MKFLERFDSYDRITKRQRPKIKRCVGQCDRKVVIDDGEPRIYCKGCDRYIEPPKNMI